MNQTPRACMVQQNVLLYGEVQWIWMLSAATVKSRGGYLRPKWSYSEMHLGASNGIASIFVNSSEFWIFVFH